MDHPKDCFAFNRNVLKPLAKDFLVPLGLMEAASASDAAIQKNILGSATTTILFSIEGLDNIMKIVESLEEYGLWIKGVSETVENSVKEQKGAFLVC